MSSFIIQKPKTESLQGNLDTFQNSCCKCGGNGYVKTSPDCYRTCLDCLGTGIKATDS